MGDPDPASPVIADAYRVEESRFHVAQNRRDYGTELERERIVDTPKVISKGSRVIYGYQEGSPSLFAFSEGWDGVMPGLLDESMPIGVCLQ